MDNNKERINLLNAKMCKMAHVINLKPAILRIDFLVIVYTDTLSQPKHEGRGEKKGVKSLTSKEMMSAPYQLPPGLRRPL